MDVSADENEHMLLTTDEDGSDADQGHRGSQGSLTESYDDEDELRRPLHRRRLATLYDTVAGKVSKETPLVDEDGSGEDISHRQRTVTRRSTRATPITPDEVLFRRKDAPVRYHEHDIYRAHERDLPRAGQGILPDSDLLKAIHLYSAKFYGAMNRRSKDENSGMNTMTGRGRMPRVGGGRSTADERSIDETGLLAFGILLEEAGRDVLGRKGDLVFTEAVREGGNHRSPEEFLFGDEVASETETSVGYHDAGSPTNNLDRTAKRRRVAAHT